MHDFCLQAGGLTAYLNALDAAFNLLQSAEEVPNQHRGNGIKLHALLIRTSSLHAAKYHWAKQPPANHHAIHLHKCAISRS